MAQPSRIVYTTPYDPIQSGLAGYYPGFTRAQNVAAKYVLHKT